MAIGNTGLGFIGIAKEATKGTAVAATAYIPVTSSSPNEATDVLIDQGMRNSMTTSYGSVKGTTSASLDLEGDVFLDTIGWPLTGIMGADAATGGPTFTHTISLLNTGTGQGPSHTLHDFNGLQARKYAAGTWSNVSLRFSAQELLTWSGSITSNASVTESTPTPSFTTVQPVAGWVGTATIAGGASTLVEEAEITFSRNVSVVQTIDGTADPNQIWQGPIDVSGRMTLVADAETEFLRYTGVTNPSLVFNFVQGAASITVTMTSTVYTDAQITRGDDFTQTAVQFTALGNTTDAGASGGFAPAKITLVNLIAGSIYI